MEGMTLQELREKRGQSLKDVANRMGQSINFVKRIEAGDDERVDSISRYVKALGGECKASISFEDGSSVELSLETLALAAKLNL